MKDFLSSLTQSGEQAIGALAAIGLIILFAALVAGCIFVAFATLTKKPEADSEKK